MMRIPLHQLCEQVYLKLVKVHELTFALWNLHRVITYIASTKDGDRHIGITHAKNNLTHSLLHVGAGARIFRIMKEKQNDQVREKKKKKEKKTRGHISYIKLNLIHPKRLYKLKRNIIKEIYERFSFSIDAVAGDKIKYTYIASRRTASVIFGFKIIYVSSYLHISVWLTGHRLNYSTSPVVRYHAKGQSIDVVISSRHVDRIPSYYMLYRYVICIFIDLSKVS